MRDKKLITIQVPCYNEENNVEPMACRLVNIMSTLPQYDYEIIFRNNASTDNTIYRLRELAKSNPHIKVISNARNYGLDPMKDTFDGRMSGDAIIYIPCDFQEPPELIPEYIAWWEKGYEVVVAQKIASKEGKLKYFLRQIFYKIIASFSEIQQVDNMSGIFLISKRVSDIWRKSNRDELFRYFITDLGIDIKIIQYVQEKRRSGKSSFGVRKLFSYALTSLVTTTSVPLRIATVLGFVSAIISFFIGVIYLILKLIFWNRFSTGTAPLLIGMFFIASVQLLFIGLLGEYVNMILRKVTPNNPPIVNELINFDNIDEDPLYFKKPRQDAESK